MRKRVTSISIIVTLVIIALAWIFRPEIKRVEMAAGAFEAPSTETYRFSDHVIRAASNPIMIEESFE